MQIGVKAVLGSLAVLCFQTIGLAQALTPQQGNQQQTNQQQYGQGQSGTQQPARITSDAAQVQAALNQIEKDVSPPQIPEGFPLDKKSQEWVDQLLTHWQSSSDVVRSYRCDFQRWHYKPGQMNWRDPETLKLAARMITRGKIRFAKPDRGRYDIDEVWHFVAPKEEGGEPSYELNEDLEARKIERECWICDGKAIYEFDYGNKRLNEMQLPPEMQGAGLKNSPLPFVFGAKADDLKNRFWIRPMPPEGIPEGHYMIEAIPKTLNDARAYSRVQIVLSQEPFLPVRVELFATNFDAKTNPDSMVLVFENRQINDPRALIQKVLSEWSSKPMTPVGWERFTGDVGKDDTDRSAQNKGNLK